MPNDKPKPSAFKQDIGKGKSDDFVMPVAPPSPPKGVVTRTGGDKHLSVVEDISRELVGSIEADITTEGTIAGETRKFYLTESENIQMCWIPPGKFMMGSPLDEPLRVADERQHLAELTKGFWMAKYAVTQEEWFAVMGTRPSAFGKQGKLMNVLSGTGDHWKALPVESVSWMDICGNNNRTGGFLEKINSKVPRGWRFDLPSETQWEYACRAGTTTAFNNGGGLARFSSLWSRNLSKLGWYRENNSEKIHPVGKKMPNIWGLHDMHGNVWEWCSNSYYDYPKGGTLDPIGPSVGEGRVNRGGGWASGPKQCRSAFRSWDKEEFSSKRLGFRLILYLAS